MPRWRIFAELFRREPHIDVTCLFLPRQFIFYIFCLLYASQTLRSFFQGVSDCDRLRFLSLVCLCVCVYISPLSTI